MSGNPVITPEIGKKLIERMKSKHKGSICIANYKGGVGKTTVVLLLGYQLAEQFRKRVLLIDIDPQCSLSLAAGFDPEHVDKKELTIYNLVHPSKWTTPNKTKFISYTSQLQDKFSPNGLKIIKGSFDIEDLDIEIVKSTVNESERRIREMNLYCTQMLNAFSDYDFVLVDCPPNKMYLTQAMMRACSFYLPVTIPDLISVYGMPRLLRWVNQIPSDERPKYLGCVINSLNRAGTSPEGMVISQQKAINELNKRIVPLLESDEKSIVGQKPILGELPRSDKIARFMSEMVAKQARDDFKEQPSKQSTIHSILNNISNKILKRMELYNAQA